MFVKEDQIDRFSVGGVSQFPGQEMGNENENNRFDDKGKTLGRRKQNNIPWTLFSPRKKDMTNRNKTTLGISFPQISIVVEQEKEELLNQYEGSGYGSKRVFINLIFGKTAILSSELFPDEINLHIHGVILTNQYNLKLGTELLFKLKFYS